VGFEEPQAARKNCFISATTFDVSKEGMSEILRRTGRGGGHGLTEEAYAVFFGVLHDLENHA